MNSYKQNLKSRYKQLIRETLWDFTWYQKFRTRRIEFKQWASRNRLSRRIKVWVIRKSVRDTLFSSFELVPGSPEWLVDTEARYGGIVYDVPIQLSPFDDDSRNMLAMGGDRMYHHGYASHYSTFLDAYVKNRDKRIVICEVGLLEGTGLAIWCDLFPNARCIGLDVDLSNVKGNMDRLRRLGAFSKNSPELFEYDQFVYSENYIKEILNGDKIDIFADDGHHSEKSIMTTLKSIAPHLNEKFVYFVEDNSDVHKIICKEYPKLAVCSLGELTVLRPLASNI